MENSSLNSETTVVETPSSEAQPVSTEAGQAGSQATAGTPSPQEISDWTKDERAQRMWFDKTKNTFDPNRMYKSYREADKLIEGQYKPLKAQAETFTKLFKDYGYEADPEKLKTALDELKTWKDPENPIVKREKYFSFFHDHPVYGKAVQSAIENARISLLQEQYPNMTEAQIQKQIELETRVEAMEQKERVAKEAEQHRQIRGTIDEGWKRVQDEAKKIGFPVTEEIRAQLLDQCAKDNIDPRFMFYQFQEMYKDEVAKHQRASIQAEMLKSRQKQQKSGVIPAGSTAPRTQTTPAQRPGMASRVMDKLGLK